MQDYTIIQFKKGDFQDNHGNYWCDAVFKGVGEPVKMVVKDPTSFTDNMSVYGEIKQLTSKAGKEYNRFYRSPKPETDESTSDSKVATTSTTKSNWTPRDDDRIVAQWAIGQAVQFESTRNNTKINTEDIEKTAKDFYSMVERVKTSIPIVEETPEAEEETKPSTEEEEMASLMASIPF